MIEAGKTRLRPILMTALAMIIGMIPMALALGEAGEQNAPLGRAVIGGLAFATVATLIPRADLLHAAAAAAADPAHPGQTLRGRGRRRVGGRFRSWLTIQPAPEARTPDPVLSRRRCCVAAAFAAVGYFHLSRNQTVATAREARGAAVDRGPRVEVVAATQGPSERTITLLADVRSNATAILYSKVSGYVKTIPVDRGDRVQAGQVVALIESPKIDQQYAAAVTDLEHKRRNLERSRELLAKGNTTQVAMLQFETDARVAEANVKGLETMKGYQTIRAPFAGRVTARFVDPGALITNAQTNMVSALPIVTISDDSRLRVFCYVQQQDVPYVNVGD